MRNRLAIVHLLSVIAFLSMIARASAATEVPLPSQADTIQAQIDAEQLLRGGRGPERALPGPVEDRERVLVAIDGAGLPHRVRVDQRLVLNGVGDFFFKVPGPAVDVEPLPGSSSQPGLRSGSVIWQGFADDGERLGARVELDPRTEVERLPLLVGIDGTVGGEDFDPSEPRGGRIDLTITLTNNTGRTIEQRSATPADAAGAASALDAVFAQLVDRERPEPGRAGIPRSIAVEGAVDETQEDQIAPLQTNLELRVPSGADVEVTGSSVGARGGRFVTSDLLSGDHRSVDIHIRGTVPAGTLELSVVAVPAPPDPDEAEPPAGKSWVAATRSGAAGGREMFERLYRVLSETARLPEFDGYLGNPDRAGPTATTYRFVLQAPEEATGEPPPEPSGTETDPVRIALLGVGLLAALAALARWWAVS